MSPAPTPIDPVRLRVGDRGILVGASGTGKSTLARSLLEWYRDDVPHGRRLILDTKPRWRADLLATGVRTGRYYRRFRQGDRIPGAMVLSDPRDWDLVWDESTNPSRTVIAQRLHGTQAANIAFQVWVSEKFFATQRAGKPSLIYWDEGMDFFSSSSSARNSDIVQRCYRAGRELDLTSLIGVQRPKGINIQCLTETCYCALFRINFVEDVKRLWEMGWPRDAPPPTYDQQYCFRLWRDSHPGAPLYRITERTT